MFDASSLRDCLDEAEYLLLYLVSFILSRLCRLSALFV